jgi:hypothetical protein
MIIKMARFDPRLPWVGMAVAKIYMRSLNALGHLIMLLAASKFVSFTVSPRLALVFVATFCTLAYLMRGKYHDYVKEILRTTTKWELLKLAARAWQFWVACIFFSGLAVGTVQWDEFETWKALTSVVSVLGLLFEGARLVLGNSRMFSA